MAATVARIKFYVAQIKLKAITIDDVPDKYREAVVEYMAS